MQQQKSNFQRNSGLQEVQNRLAYGHACNGLHGAGIGLHLACIQRSSVRHGLCGYVVGLIINDGPNTVFFHSTVDDALQQHFILSATLTALLTLILPWYWASLITLAVGAAKETYDRVSGRGSAEWKDVLCNLAGTIIGAI
jgi:hypothetical protein